MITDPTATTSAATSNGTPFDAIVALEEAEKKRLEDELSAMQKEEATVVADIEKRVATAEESAKKQAQAELNEFKTAEPTEILKKAKKEAEAVESSLESAYNNQSKELAKQLVTSFISNA